MPDRPSNEEIEATVRADIEQQDYGSVVKTSRTAIIKRGIRKWKAVQSRTYDKDGNEKEDRRELRFGTWGITQSDGVSRSIPNSWRCDGSEIDILRELLDSDDLEGDYCLVEKGSVGRPAVDHFAALLERGDVEEDALSTVLEAILRVPSLIDTMADSDFGEALTTALEAKRRKVHLERLETLLDNADTNETKLHNQLKNQTWIFGGKYLGEHARKQLSITSRVDIPLIRGDGSLHIVELKGCHIPRLIVEHRNKPIVGHEINEAVGQALNYLYDIDRQADYLGNILKVDCQRASATVVIGDSRHGSVFAEEDISRTIRTYNSHLSRIDVMTWDQLVGNARRVLNYSPGTETGEDENDAFDQISDDYT